MIVLLPDFDYKKLDASCNVLDGEIVRESQLCYDEEEEEETLGLWRQGKSK